MTGASSARVRPRRVLVIANPAAGARARARRVAGAEAARAAARAGLAVELRLTERPGDARRFAAEAAGGGFDLVVAEGGDGTVHEAANGIAGSGVALGVAPAGTMNILARLLRLPLDPGRAVSRIVDGYSPLRMRPGEASGRLFVLMAGVGFDAWVLRALLRSTRSKIGFGDYVRGALSGLRTFPFPELAIRSDGTPVAGHTAIVGRAPLYGGFLRPTPHARLDVDALEVCAFDGGATRLAALVPRLWSGAHAGCAGVTLTRASSVHVSAKIDDVPYHLDGELAGTLPVAIGMSERILVLATIGRVS